MQRAHEGSSLLEMLAAIALLATLTALAMPGYQRHLQRARRADASTFLLRVYAAQQNHFLQHGRYVLVTEDVPRAPAEGGLGISLRSEFGEFRLSIDATDSGYVASAVSLRANGSDPCIRFSIDEAGLRRAFDAAGTDHSAECLG
jgi:type IV pilus assembly protein PilE